MKNVLLGAHVSIAGGLHKAFDHAEKYDCSAIQIFTQNSSTWKIRELKENEIEVFKKRKEESCVESVIAHAGYLINLAGTEPEKKKKSLKSLQAELRRAEQLGIENLVLHPGSHMKTSVEAGIERLSESINMLFNEIPGNTKILFETTAGQGDSIGHRLDHIQQIIEKTEQKERTGICIDTCHVFAAGYEIDREDGYNAFVNELDSRLGIDSVKCIHLNDSRKSKGSKVDRHEHIGMGYIGDQAFKLIMNDKRFVNVPKIIETPGEKDGIDMNKVNFGKLLSFCKL